MRGDLGTFPENDSRASCEVAECRRFMNVTLQLRLVRVRFCARQVRVLAAWW